MRKNTLDELFKNLKNDFDYEEPNSNHEQRFLDKLNTQDSSKIVELSSIKKRSLWKSIFGVAASILLLITLFIGGQNNANVNDLASVSPEMAQTQDFFTLTIADELNKINKETSPETQSIIEDAMVQMKTLESEYELLKLDLEDSGDDKRVIYAMISNFQSRIDLLQNTLEHINTVKQFKQAKNENSSTI